MGAIELLGMIPSRINYIHNPSFEVGTTGWQATNASLIQSIEASWTGGLSCKLTVNSVVTAPRVRTSVASAVPSKIPLVAGDKIAGAVRVRGEGTSIGRNARIYIEYYTSTNVLIGSTIFSNYITLTSTFQRIELYELEAPATVDYMSFGVRFEIDTLGGGTASIVGDVFYIDGADVAINQELDTYVDGSQGSGYVWLGTVNDSNSMRLESVPTGITGWGGVVQFVTNVFRSDMYGYPYEDLTDYVIGGEVSNDIDRDIKGLIKLTIDDPTKFDLYSWITVFGTLSVEGIEEYSGPLGVFRLTSPNATWLSGSGDISGSDPTIILQESTITTTLNLTSGIGYIAAVEAQLIAAGFAGRYSIPTTTRTLAGPLSFPPGTTRLAIINQLLTACGYYSIYALPDGRLASFTYMNRNTVEPAHTFKVGYDAEMVGDIVESINDNAQYNYVIATRTNQSSSGVISILQGTAENANPLHPYSTVSLGKLAGVSKVYRTKVIALTDTTAAGTLNLLNERAREELALASMLRYITLSILPHPEHIPHEVVDLDLSLTNASHLSGRYYAESSSYGLGGDDSTMTLKLRRVEDFDS